MDEVLQGLLCEQRLGGLFEYLQWVGEFRVSMSFVFRGIEMLTLYNRTDRMSRSSLHVMVRRLQPSGAAVIRWSAVHRVAVLRLSPFRAFWLVTRLPQFHHRPRCLYRHPLQHLLAAILQHHPTDQ